MERFFTLLAKYIPAFMRITGVILITLTCAMAVYLSNNIAKSYSHRDHKNWLRQIVFTLESWEESFHDMRMKHYLDSENLEPIDGPVLLAIDDSSLNEIGTFPIPRRYWAQMMGRLGQEDAKVVAFDVLFPEKSLTCGDGENSQDELFVQSILDFKAISPEKEVVLAYTVDKYPGKEIEPPFELITTMQTVKNLREKFNPETGKMEFVPGMTDMPFYKMDKNNFVHQMFLDAEVDLAYINNEEDYDGVYRHYTIYSRVLSKDLEGSMFLPSLGLSAYKASKKSVNFFFEVDNSDSSSILKSENGNLTSEVPINPQGGIKIKWKKDRGYFPAISLSELLNPTEPGKLRDLHIYPEVQSAKAKLAVLKKTDPNYEENKNELENFIKINEPHQYVDLKDRIVFVGSTAAGWHDLRNSPINPIMPGVYAHMTITRMLMENSFYKDPDVTIKYNLYLLLISVLILSFIMIFNNAIMDIIGLVGIMAGLYLVDRFYFHPQNYDLKLLFVVIANVSSYSFITILNFSKASAEKKQIKGAFSRYVAPAIVDDMLENPDKLKVGGERKDITCLFSDVRDFTSISEQLTPTELASALNRYMGEMTDIVFETNGTLDKYIGDAIVAFWGAPVDIGDHVNQAMDGAVRMLEALPAINQEFEEKNLPEFKIGLGLNSGECSVGNMGSDAIFAYTALGDNMNLGARLESLCKHYGAQILVSEFTFERMDQNRFTSRCIDKVRVKGKTEPVGVYEVLYSYHPLMVHQNALRDFKNAYELYLEGKFGKAKELFELVLTVVPEDKASLRLKESCEYWMSNPPQEGDDWTITTMTTK
ncbi:MAG: hypothetical protein CME65_05215 [Halobacteriovoraceae bacterium]|nr:hypothetical protein [Halobacteriovoraceae bacterium]